MSRPTLYYTLFSPPSRACILTAKLINLDLELKSIDFVHREHHSDWYLKLNPRHTVPVLVDDGNPLCDSHGIITYMVSKYAPNDNLYPKDLIKRSRVDELLYYENGVLSQCIKDFVRKILNGNDIDYSPESIGLCLTAYEFLEQFLQKNKYVAGDQMTVADVSINTTLITLNKIVPINEDRYPRTYDWIEKMKDIPSYFDVNEQGAYQFYTRILASLTENRFKTVGDGKPVE